MMFRITHDSVKIVQKVKTLMNTNEYHSESNQLLTMFNVESYK